MVKCVLVGFLVVFCSLSAFAAQYKWEVVRVVDGDTVIVTANWLLPELGNHISIRVLGVDTPEKPPRAKCENEAVLAESASSFVKSIIHPGDVVIVTPKGFDKYGGRILGNVYIPNHGDLSKLLVDNNYAHPYYGKTKQSWCN